MSSRTSDLYRKRKAETHRWWFCFCGPFYTGGNVAQVYEEEPDEVHCHRMGGCGWMRVEGEEE